MIKKPFRVVIVSDLHTGSAHALRVTPENATQEALLDRWRACIKLLGKPDLLIVNGDAVDGQDRKSMSVDKTDVPWQVEEAAGLIEMWNPRRVVITEGSAYHTGDTVQHEKYLARLLDVAGVPTSFHTKFNGKIGGWFKLQARHKIGRSTVPYGAHTAPARSVTHQVLNAAIEARNCGEPVTWPHLSVFSHVHYWSYNETAGGASMTTPCWKAVGDRYGDTQCDGHVDIGCAWVDVGASEKEGWTWGRMLYAARVESRTVNL